MFKKLGMIAAVVILLAIVAPVFLPAHFSMSRSIEINAPIGAVFSNLTDLNVYVKWIHFLKVIRQIKQTSPDLAWDRT